VVALENLYFDVSGNANATTQSFKSLASSLNSLANAQKKITNIGGVNAMLKSTARALNDMPNFGGRAQQNLINISQGYKTLGSSLRNVSLHGAQASVALRGVVESLNTMPALNKNATSLLNSLNMLPKTSQMVYSSSQKMATGFNAVGKSAQYGGNGLMHLLGMAKRYVVTGFVIHAFSKVRELFAGAVRNTMHWTEAINYFNVAYGELAETAGAFYDELSATLGLDIASIAEPSATFQQIARSIGYTADEAYSLSRNLIKIGLDLSSLTDRKYSEVFEDLQAGILAGQTKTVRKYGVDLTEASLKQTALNEGILVNVENMSQLDKVYLRYKTLFNSAMIAQGDFAKTLETPSNALRVWKSSLDALSRAVGSVFIPVLTRVIPYVIAFTRCIQQAVQAIGIFFGYTEEQWKNTDFSGRVDVSEYFDDIEGSAGGASGAVDKLKKNIMGFDQFHILKDMASSGGGGGGIGVADTIQNKNWEEWDMLLDQITGGKVDAIMGNITSAMKPLSDAFANLYDAVVRAKEPLLKLWDKVLVPFGTWAIGTFLPSVVDTIAKIADFFADNPEWLTALLSFVAALKIMGGLSGVSIALGGGGALAGLAGAGGAALSVAAVTLTAGAVYLWGTEEGRELAGKLGELIYELKTLPFFDPKKMSDAELVEKAIKLNEKESLTEREFNTLYGISKEIARRDFTQEQTEAINAFLEASEKYSDGIWTLLSTGDRSGLTEKPVYSFSRDYWAGEGSLSSPTHHENFPKEMKVLAQDVWALERGYISLEQANKNWQSVMSKSADAAIDAYADVNTEVLELTPTFSGLAKTAEKTNSNIGAGSIKTAGIIKSSFSGASASAVKSIKGIGVAGSSAVGGVARASATASSDALNGMKSTWEGVAQSINTSVSASMQTVMGAIGNTSMLTAAAVNYRNFSNVLTDTLRTMMVNTSRTVESMFRMFAGLPPSIMQRLGMSMVGYKPVNIPQLKMYASGGFPSMGELFLARENGAEMVGSFGNKTAVANNEQIVSGITYGVASGIRSVMNSTVSVGGSGGDYQITYRAVRDAIRDTQKDDSTVLILDGKAVGEAVVKRINNTTTKSGVSPIRTK